VAHAHRAADERVDNMLYMYSTSRPAVNEMNLRVSFDITTSEHRQVLVNMRYSQALSSLPQESSNRASRSQKNRCVEALFGAVHPALAQGHLRRALPHATTGLVNLNEPDDAAFRVGQVLVFGANTVRLRFWVNPDPWPSFDITVNEIVRALQAQNTVTSGRPARRQAPCPGPGVHDYTVLAQGRLGERRGFENVVVSQGDSRRVHRAYCENVAAG